MSIYRRKETGIYYLKIKNGVSYRRISLGTKNKDYAQALYQAYLAETVKAKLFGLVVPPIPRNTELPRKKKSSSNRKNKRANLSFTKIHEKYLDTCKAQNITEYTIKRKIKTFQSLTECGLNSLSAINQDALNKLLGTWAELSNETQIRHIKNLKAFLNYAINCGLYSIHTYKTLKFPTLRGSVRDIINYPKKTIQGFYAERQTGISPCIYRHFGKRDAVPAPSAYHIPVASGVTASLPNEIVNLKKSDIDFDKGIGKIYQSKTKKYKTVYLTDELLEKIKNLKTEYIFEGFDRQKEYYAKKFRDLRDELGMNKEYCLYAFRHSFGNPLFIYRR